MSDTQRSAVALRTLIVGELGYPSVTDPNDTLVGVNTQELPDGAAAYVLAAGAVYRLHKTLTPPNVASSAFIVPANGIGVWAFESGDGSPFSFQATGTASLTGSTAVVQNTWVALPSGSGFYTTSSSGVPFSFSTTSGIVTYSGPNRHFKVTAIGTILCATAAQAMEFAITQNGFLVGATTFDATAAAANADPTTASLGFSMGTTKFVTLANNDTLQAVMRNTTGTPGNLNATHLNFVIAAA